MGGTEPRPPERLFAAVQRGLPTRWLSEQAFALTRIRQATIKNTLIRAFVSRFAVDLSEARLDQAQLYPHFNAFFTRELAAGARPQDPEALLVSPADGRLSEFGAIDGDQLVQAKGHLYRLVELLGGHEDLAEPFRGGWFATIYLAPRDYHRLHMPIAGELRETVHVPGRLFSVNAATASAMPGLFTRNERLLALFDTEAGPLALVLVGALFVGSIETVWAGALAPPHRRSGIRRETPPHRLRFERGAEFARFNMGSTVIVLGASRAFAWRKGLSRGTAVKVGQGLADRVGLGPGLATARP